jgi:hypothetical protein
MRAGALPPIQPQPMAMREWKSKSKSKKMIIPSGKENSPRKATQLNGGKMMVNRLLKLLPPVGEVMIMLIPLMTLALGRMFLMRTVGCSITQLESVGGMLVKFVGSTIMLPMTVEDACHGTWVLSFVQFKWKIKASFSFMSVLIQEL